MKKRNNPSERGNAFIIILIAVVLFAALIFTVSNSMRSATTSRLSEREADLAAADIVNYAQSVERAVDRLRRKGVSESDLSFENTQILLYTNPNCSSAECKIFDPAGGGAAFRQANNFIPGMVATFRFNGNNRFAGYGCDAGNSSCSDLVIELAFNEHPEVCMKINDLMGTENPSGNAPRLNEWLSGVPFTGTFSNPTADLVGGANATNEAPQLKGKPGGCFYEFGGGQNTYAFYYILLAR